MFSSSTILFSLLTLFSFRPQGETVMQNWAQGETVMQNWAYLAFKLMKKVSCSYILQVRGFGAAGCNSKVFNISSPQKKSSVEK